MNSLQQKKIKARKKPSLRLQSLYPVYDSHGYSYDGGRKIHVLNALTNTTLCGRQSLFNDCDLRGYGGDVTQFMNQPDPDKAFCQTCKRIYDKTISEKK